MSPDSLESEKKAFYEAFKVPRETMDRFDRYAELLIEWNQIHNLVAKSTVPHLWLRHFLDSAQLYKRIPRGAKTLVDIGSGAGFPGLVLAIMAEPEKAFQVHLVESVGKKADFLKLVVKELGLSAVVHYERAENLKELKADVVTARAVSSLRTLIEMSTPLLSEEACLLFLKGQKVDAELTEASKYWMFNYKKIKSQTPVPEEYQDEQNLAGYILKIENIHHKRPQNHYDKRKRL